VSQCADDTDCAGGQDCENSICVAYCTGDEECLSGEECKNFRCRMVSPHKRGCGCSSVPDARVIALPALLLLALLWLLARRLRGCD
jgi:MYXO-CTERM domain-containing protein